jgi:large subunit ribosomal protein L9
MRRSRQAREAREREAAEALAKQLGGRRIEIRARAGEGGRLFGSVTSADVVDAVRAQTGVELDRRKTQLAEPLKELGVVDVPVKLDADVEVNLTVEVVSE